MEMIRGITRRLLFVIAMVIGFMGILISSFFPAPIIYIGIVLSGYLAGLIINDWLRGAIGGLICGIIAAFLVAPGEIIGGWFFVNLTEYATGWSSNTILAIAVVMACLIYGLIALAGGLAGSILREAMERE